MKELALEFLPYHTFKNLSIKGKVDLIITKVKENKIIILEGKLSEDEKKELIKNAMEHFNFKFKGIEMESIDFIPDNFIEKVKAGLVNLFYKNRIGFTVIGPANIVEGIKKDPNELLVYMNTKKF